MQGKMHSKFRKRNCPPAAAPSRIHAAASEIWRAHAPRMLSSAPRQRLLWLKKKISARRVRSPEKTRRFGNYLELGPGELRFIRRRSSTTLKAGKLAATRQSGQAKIATRSAGRRRDRFLKRVVPGNNRRRMQRPRVRE